MKRVALAWIVAAAAAFGQANPAPVVEDQGTVKVPLQAAPANRGGRGVPARAAVQVQAKETWSPRDLKYPPLRVAPAPKVSVATLPNGMRLYLMEEHELPVVAGLALVRTGGAFDPPDRIGLAAIAGKLLRSGGTSLKTGEQVEEALQKLGMTAEAGIEETSASLSFTGLKEHANESLALLKEILTEPEFRQDRLEQAKAEMRTAIAHRNDDLAVAGRRELTALVFGKGSPYGWQPEYNTIERITRTDLKKFHERYFFPANTMLGLWGDFDAAGMKTTVENLFAGWTVKQEEVPAFPKVNATPAPGIYLARKREALETYITVGELSGVAGEKDYPALEVMGRAFNQLQARITKRSREPLGPGNMGLLGLTVENVAAAWGAGVDHAGVFRISASTRGASTVDAVKAIQGEVERMRTAEITEEELRTAKEAALAALAGERDTHAKAFYRYLNREYYGLPKDFAAQYQAGLMAVTKADVLRVAKEHLKPGNLTTVVVGNPQVFSEPLEKLNPQVNTFDLTIPEPKQATTQVTESSIAEGKRMLARAQAAVGGADKLAAVKDYVIDAEYLIDPGVQKLGGSKVPQTDRWIAPAAFRQDLSLPTGRVSAYTDGNAGWISTPQGWGALAGTQLKQVRGDLFRAYVRLLLSDRIEGRTVNAVDRDSIEVSDTSGQIARLEFDGRTGMPRRVTYDVPQAAGAPIFSEDVYSDFREVNGIKAPFRITISQGGKKFAEVVVKSFQMNAGLKAEDLARRTQ